MSAQRLAAWSVHLYTALGAVLGFLALVATARAAYGSAFLCMMLATVIDATDGTLARRLHVKQLLPTFDGAKLDDIVDYLNYVVVPVVLAQRAALVPQGVPGLLAAALPLIASGYGFCQTDAKTSDHFFTGFPSYWNVVVFYFYALATPVWLNVGLLVLLSALVFVPIRYLYPSRNPTARRTTYGLGLAWACALVVLLWQFPAPSRRLAQASLVFPAYYMLLSFHLHFRGEPPDTAPHRESLT